MKEQIVNFEVGYYCETIDLFKFNLNCNLIIGLYHMWEQQSKSFYYFCKCKQYERESFKIKDIKDMYNELNVNIEKLAKWPVIDELRLLVNTLKHGGKNNKKLKKINPDLFVHSEKNLHYLSCEFKDYNYNTTFSEINMNISQKIIERYKMALIEFWDGIYKAIY